MGASVVEAASQLDGVVAVVGLSGDWEERQLCGRRPALREPPEPSTERQTSYRLLAAVVAEVGPTMLAGELVAVRCNSSHGFRSKCFPLGASVPAGPGVRAQQATLIMVAVVVAREEQF